MKNRKVFLITAAGAVIIAVSTTVSTAQPPQNGRSPERPAMNAGRPAETTPEESARRKTDILQEELELDGKQYKKVYKLYLKQANKELSSSRSPQNSEFSGGMSGGQGSGMGPGGGMQGGPPSGMGMSGGGRQPSMGGGMPEGSDPRMQSERMQNVSGKNMDGPYLEGDKEIAAKEKKMEKILSPVQYSKWLHWEQDDRQMRARRIIQQDMGNPAGATKREFPERNR